MYTNNGYKWGQSEQRDRAVCMVYIYIPLMHEKKGGGQSHWTHFSISIMHWLMCMAVKRVAVVVQSVFPRRW